MTDTTTTTGPAPTAPPHTDPEVATRPPRFATPWPLVLVESTSPAAPGEWLSAELTRSDLVGECYWLEWGEHHADVYATFPGSDFQIVTHSGHWTDHQGTGLTDAVTQLERRTHYLAATEQPPPVVIVSTVTATWDSCKRWAGWRSTQSQDAQRIVNGVIKPGMRRQQRPEYVTEPDPHAGFVIAGNIWDDAYARHRQLIERLRRMPAIVVIHAHTRTTDNGPELDTLADVVRRVHAWVRVTPDQSPTIVTARNYDYWRAHRPGQHTPTPDQSEPGTDPEDITAPATEDTPATTDPDADFLERLIFEVLEFDPISA